mmetsp:Transcript_38237/g.48728  ORF Transcript_38237/g.48728 Transcript_38237/m.48728 type:complete len:160 (+) Transcript_38237:222-701(+)
MEFNRFLVFFVMILVFRAQIQGCFGVLQRENLAEDPALAEQGNPVDNRKHNLIRISPSSYPKSPDNSVSNKKSLSPAHLEEKETSRFRSLSSEKSDTIMYSYSYDFDNETENFDSTEEEEVEFVNLAHVVRPISVILSGIMMVLLTTFILFYFCILVKV